MRPTRSRYFFDIHGVWVGNDAYGSSRSSAETVLEMLGFSICVFCRLLLALGFSNRSLPLNISLFLHKTLNDITNTMIQAVKIQER